MPRYVYWCYLDSDAVVESDVPLSEEEVRVKAIQNLKAQLESGEAEIVIDEEEVE